MILITYLSELTCHGGLELELAERRAAQAASCDLAVLMGLLMPAGSLDGL
mgnify:CR=1 FL=1